MFVVAVNVREDQDLETRIDEAFHQQYELAKAERIKLEFVPGMEANIKAIDQLLRDMVRAKLTMCRAAGNYVHTDGTDGTDDNLKRPFEMRIESYRDHLNRLNVSLTLREMLVPVEPVEVEMARMKSVLQ